MPSHDDINIHAQGTGIHVLVSVDMSLGQGLQCVEHAQMTIIWIVLILKPTHDVKIGDENNALVKIMTSSKILSCWSIGYKFTKSAGKYNIIKIVLIDLFSSEGIKGCKSKDE